MPAITHIQVLSVPSKTLVIGIRDLIAAMSTRRGCLILSTSRGILTDREAIKLHTGGVCLVLVLI